MDIINLIKISLTALSRNKGRSFLTMLGIIIGIASVIVMVSLGKSATGGVRSEFSTMGSNMIMIMPTRSMRGGVDMGTGQSLTKRDLESLEKNTKYVQYVSPSVSAAAQLVYGGNNHSGSLQGVSADYLEIRKYSLESGIMFTDEHTKTNAKVCVIGKTVVDELFTNGENPIGQTIRCGRVPMKVIGVLASKGQNGMGQDQDDIVLAPYTTIMTRFSGNNNRNNFQMIFASATSEEESEMAATEITYILRSNHNIKINADNEYEDDFEIRTQEEILSAMSNVMRVLTLLLTSIAAISLIVGGIGIMNIMYVTVTERTKEIGLRMAIGAKRRDVMLQFLSESIILSLLGGVIGIVIGSILATVITTVLKWTLVISMGAIGISFLVCVATGVFFGWYPARKAANMDPITALRYE